MEQNASFDSNLGRKLVRKAYAKPKVQVYGTVAQLSETGNNPAANKSDGGNSPSGHNRT
jgi:hypothetical protein